MVERKVVCAVFAVAFSATMVMGARIRDGGDPNVGRVIWADPFDNYSQWAWNNNQLWYGGPMPAGATNGSYPTKGPTSSTPSGCGVSVQVTPASHHHARQNWQKTMNCGVIVSPTGQPADPGAFEASYDPNCGVSGGIANTFGMFATLNYCWFQGGSRSSMTMWDYNLATRIQQIATTKGLGTKNSINGTDANPLVLAFDILDYDVAAQRNGFNNVYVELSLAGDHAPTDYIWRGNPTGGGAEYCPQGPYPIICQQVREVNTSVSEGPADLVYLNQNCPPLVPPYDPQTGQGRTWSSIAFGLLAIMDKDPCGLDEQSIDAHKPTMDHFVVFDGNKWRELRNNRYRGLLNLPAQGGQTLPWGDPNQSPNPGGFDPSMQLDPSETLDCNNFTSGGGGRNRVYMKIISDWILLYVQNNFYDPAKTLPPWHACVPRVYKGPFDAISVGVGPGCELDSATYTCKQGGTPKQCLTYSTNFEAYWRPRLETMSLYDGELIYAGMEGACCKPDGECVVTDQANCALYNGSWRGMNTTCQQYLCCPTPFANVDAPSGDRDVDQVDFAAFQLCYTGGSTGVPSGCECLDRNSDNRINAADFTQFNNCYTGANVPWSQALTPSCSP
ncbi:MAG TPA: hypothetical protein VLM89_01855 [Phycisphaerae bacterium]|nr:hypothetical protein [Phycisphaerae bacterium]